MPTTANTSRLATAAGKTRPKCLPQCRWPICQIAASAWSARTGRTDNHASMRRGRYASAAKKSPSEVEKYGWRKLGIISMPNSCATPSTMSMPPENPHTAAANRAGSPAVPSTRRGGIVPVKVAAIVGAVRLAMAYFSSHRTGSQRGHAWCAPTPKNARRSVGAPLLRTG